MSGLQTRKKRKWHTEVSVPNLLPRPSRSGLAVQEIPNQRVITIRSTDTPIPKNRLRRCGKHLALQRKVNRLPISVDHFLCLFELADLTLTFVLVVDLNSHPGIRVGDSGILDNTATATINF